MHIPAHMTCPCPCFEYIISTEYIFFLRFFQYIYTHGITGWYLLVRIHAYPTFMQCAHYARHMLAQNALSVTIALSHYQSCSISAYVILYRNLALAESDFHAAVQKNSHSRHSFPSRIQSRTLVCQTNHPRSTKFMQPKLAGRLEYQKIGALGNI